jgi:hypothetical protein
MGGPIGTDIPDVIGREFAFACFDFEARQPEIVRWQQINAAVLEALTQLESFCLISLQCGYENRGTGSSSKSVFIASVNFRYPRHCNRS